MIHRKWERFWKVRLNIALRLNGLTVVGDKWFKLNKLRCILKSSRWNIARCIIVFNSSTIISSWYISRKYFTPNISLFNISTALFNLASSLCNDFIKSMMACLFPAICMRETLSTDKFCSTRCNIFCWFLFKFEMALRMESRSLDVSVSKANDKIFPMKGINDRFFKVLKTFVVQQTILNT